MKHAKQLLCLALCCLFLTCALLPAFAAEEPTVSGKCGSYAGYTLNTETGELRIYMVGGAKSAYMDNFKNHTSPFYGNPAIKTVVIESWVWNIGSEAFAGCSNLEQVYMAFTVKEIGTNAFAGCNKASFTFEGTRTAWKDVTIGEGNDRIGDHISFSTEALDRVSAALPLPHNGDRVKLNQTLEVGDSGKYEAQVVSVSFEENGQRTYLKDGSTLKEGTVYEFEIAFYPLEGFAIEEETAFEINGTPQNAEFGTVKLSLVPATDGASADTGGQTEENRQNEPDEGLCPLCRKDHSKQPLGFLLQWFHSMIYRLKNLFKK